MNDFTISVQLTQKNLKDFYSDSLLKFKPFYTQKIFSVTCFSIVVPAIYFSSGYYQDTISDTCFSILAICPVFILLVSYRTIKQGEKVYKSNVKLQHEICYTFNNEEIRSRGYNFEGTYKWPEINKVISSKKFLLIYCSVANVLIIPLNDLTPEQVNQIQLWQTNIATT